MLKKLRRKLTVVFTALTGLVLGAALSVGFIMSYNQRQQNALLEYDMAVYRMVNYLAGTDEPKPEVLTQFEKEEGFAVRVSVYNADTLEGREIEFEEGLHTRSPREELFEKAEILNTASIIESGIGDLSGQDARQIKQSMAEYYVRILGEEFPTLVEEAQKTLQDAKTSDSSVIEFSTENSYMAVIAQFSNDAVMAVGFNHELQEIKGSAGDVYKIEGMMYPGKHNIYDVLMLQDLSRERWAVAMLAAQYIGLMLAGLVVLWLVSNLLAKQMLKTTEKGMQQQADFVAAASHELKSPLAVVRSCLSAAEAATDEETSRNYRKNAEAEAERMGRLLDDLLLLAGGDAGTWQVMQAEVDADTLLIDAGEQFAPLAKKKGMRLTVSLPEETLPPVRGDRDRLHQVLAVLLDNALSYAPEGSEVTLSAKVRKNKLDIDVADRGPGIADADKAKLFDRFYRVDKSRTDKAHFGLGLAVAKELAELNKAGLSVLDTPGGGATFRLSLPLNK